MEFTLSETSAPHKMISVTDYPWYPPSVTLRQQSIPDLRCQFRSLIFLHLHIVNTLQPGQLWIEARFFACNPNNQAPIITIVATNLHVQIVWLQGSRLHHPPLYTRIKYEYLLVQQERDFDFSFYFDLSLALRLAYNLCKSVTSGFSSSPRGFFY